MKLLRSPKKDVYQDKDVQNIQQLESVEEIFVHCNLVNNNYKQSFKVLITFVSDKQLIIIAPLSLAMLNISMQNLNINRI